MRRLACISWKRPNNHVALIGEIHTDVLYECCRLWQHTLPLNKTDFEEVL